MAAENEIERGMARAFFVTAWAEQAEECGHQFAPGERIDLSAPRDTDPSALHAARTLKFDMERKFDMSLEALYEAHPADRVPEAVDPLDPERWGWYAAMGAMGHGVGLWDFGIDLDVPYVEFGSYSLERDYFDGEDT